MPLSRRFNRRVSRWLVDSMRELLMRDNVTTGRWAAPVTMLASALALGAVSLAGASIAGAQADARPTTCASCGHNLIKNGGAEAGKGAVADVKVKVPDWTQTKKFTVVRYTWSSGDLTKHSVGPGNRGKNYFYGGPDNHVSTGSQVVPVAAGGVSSGTVTFKLSGWLGGYSSQTDNAVLTARFEKANGAALSTATIGPVTEGQRKDVSELLRRSTTGKVPAGTRQVVVTLTMTRHSGTDNDGMADDLSLVFTA
jgi:hypothetical protein